jgi:uncharacterized membrane protein YqjE
LWGAAALLFLSFGVLLLSFALVVLFWDTHRLLSAMVLGVVHLAIGGALAVAARRCTQRPRPFTASLAELAKDRDTLAPK